MPGWRGKAIFGFETTLAGRAYLRLIQRLRAAEWRVELIYLVLPDPEMARQRVAERVAHGGHDIPQADVERRFYRGLANLFDHYMVAVDRVKCLSSEGEQPKLVFAYQGGKLDVLREDVFKRIKEMASHAE